MEVARLSSVLIPSTVDGFGAPDTFTALEAAGAALIGGYSYSNLSDSENLAQELAYNGVFVLTSGPRRTQMGWRFRKSINLGPFRINLSKKGAGVSAGVPGFRVGHDASGRNYSQTSIPGTGIYRRDYYGSAGPSSATPPLASQTPAQPTQNVQSSRVAQGSSAGVSPGAKYLAFLVCLAGVSWVLIKILLH
jgi:Protein of unknown function (DUF4236)